MKLHKIIVLGNQVYSFFKNLIISAPSRELVVAALQGQELEMDEIIGGAKFSHWVASGALINSNVTGYDIPTLSPFFLRIFLRNNLPHKDPLRKALQKVVEPNENDEMQWYDFERFHVNWEILMRIIYQRDISYATLYHLDEMNGLPEFKPVIKTYRGVTDFFSEEVR